MKPIRKYERDECPNRKHHPDADTPCLLCCECECCEAERTQSGTSSPFALLGLLLALVPLTLLVTFSARLAGMLAGTVGGVA